MSESLVSSDCVGVRNTMQDLIGKCSGCRQRSQAPTESTDY